MHENAFDCVVCEMATILSGGGVGWRGGWGWGGGVVGGGGVKW